MCEATLLCLFRDLTIPPAYTSSETMYKTGAATNFISLVSEGKETAATCYRVDGCTDPGLVCVLEPAVFEDGKSPITSVFSFPAGAIPSMSPLLKCLRIWMLIIYLLYIIKSLLQNHPCCHVNGASAMPDHEFSYRLPVEVARARFR